MLFEFKMVFNFLGLLKICSPTTYHTWLKDANGVPSYVSEVKGYVELKSYFCASYYDIGVPCKLLPPCQWDRASLLAVFFIWQL